MHVHCLRDEKTCNVYKAIVAAWQLQCAVLIKLNFTTEHWTWVMTEHAT